MVSLGKKVTIPIFLIILYITIAQFVSPLTMEPGTVVHLHGNANMLDFSNKWDELSLYHRIVYYFGDFNCHQFEERSLTLNGNQMPMCSRCTGIFTGLSIGMAIAIAAPVRRSGSEILLNIMPKFISRCIMKGDRRLLRRTERDYVFSPILVGLSILLILPMVLDGLGQTILRLWESTNAARLVTGSIFGVVSFFWFTAYVHSVLYEPLLPPGPSEPKGGGRV